MLCCVATHTDLEEGCEEDASSFSSPFLSPLARILGSQEPGLSAVDLLLSIFACGHYGGLIFFSPWVLATSREKEICFFLASMLCSFMLNGQSGSTCISRALQRRKVFIRFLRLRQIRSVFTARIVSSSHTQARRRFGCWGYSDARSTKIPSFVGLSFWGDQVARRPFLPCKFIRSCNTWRVPT